MALTEAGSNVLSAGIGAATSVANGFIEQAFSEHNRKRNYYWNEKAADSADQRQRAQYKDLYSPQAMMEQYAAAGLSPSMMMSGGQSAVGGTPHGAQGGIEGPYPSGPQINPLMAAQMANIWADTKKKEAETLNINADSEFTYTNILKVAEETNNYKLQNSILKIEKESAIIKKDLLALDRTEKEETLIAKIDAAIENVNLIRKQIENIDKSNVKLQQDIDFTAETFATKVNQVTAEYYQTIAKTSEIYTNIAFTNEQIDALTQKIAIDWFNARTNRLNANVKQQELDKQVQQWAVENGIAKDTLKHEKTKKWLQFIASLIGSGCDLAGDIYKANLKK